MVEINGWASLWISNDSSVSDDSPQTAQGLDTIRTYVERAKSYGAFAELIAQDGATILIVAGHAKRRSARTIATMEIFHMIAKSMPGSYGLVYYSDDDDPDGYHDRFRVWRLARGKFEEMEDQLLSPISEKLG